MLTDDEKSGYLAAEVCLQSQPATLNFTNAQTKWDELQYTHIKQTNWVHSNGQFLPWHRYYMGVHAHLLRDLCDYTGSLPYWDELAAVELTTLNQSDIFTADAFGGNGDTADENRCVTDGPFANLTMRMRYDLEDATTYCLARKFSDVALPAGVSAAIVETCMEYENYTTAWECFAGTIHGSGHIAVSGTMGHVANAAGDPVFFLHHTWLDAQWWKWQSLNLTTRLTDMGGDIFPTDDFLARNVNYGGTPGPEYTDYDGDEGNTTTLNHVLWSGGIDVNVTVADVMDIGGDFMCGEYVYPDDE